MVNGLALSARRAATLLVGALLLAGLSACGGTSSSSSAEGTTPTTTEPPPSTTTTTVPPGGRQPTADDPLRVLLAGDSMMGNLSPALEAALDGGGLVDAKFVLSPAVARDATSQVLWQTQLAEFDPDVIVLMMGVWERGQEPSVGQPGWREQYEATLLNPFAQLLTSGGAKVVWVGMPAVPDPIVTLEFAALDQAFEGLSQRYPDQFQYVDGGAEVSAPDGGHIEVVPIPGGGELRLRRVDGTHLCPDGVVLISRPVLRIIQHDWNVPLLDRWEQAPWRLPENVERAEECPGI